MRLDLIDDCETAAEAAARARKVVELRKRRFVIEKRKSPEEETPAETIRRFAFENERLMKENRYLKACVNNPKPAPGRPPVIQSSLQGWLVDFHGFAPLDAAAIAAGEIPVNPQLTFMEIKREVGRQFGVTMIEIESDRRAASIVNARQISMVLCRHLTARSTVQIGIAHGGRDHTTVLHAVRVYAKAIAKLPFSLSTPLNDWVAAGKRLVAERVRKYRGHAKVRALGAE